MGQAKLKRQNAVPTVYHHTSILRTNQLWMSGIIDVEGKTPTALHPELGEVSTSAQLRRAFSDFPPVAWFTTQINIPRCLQTISLMSIDKETGEKNDEIRMGAEEANAIALNRVALGFRIADIPVVKWTEHPGYKTPEGQDLNASAMEAGDNPADWWVSEQPVDVTKMSEFWSSGSILKPRLERKDNYIADVKRMVAAAKLGATIPPSWMKPDEAKLFAVGLYKPGKKRSFPILPV